LLVDAGVQGLLGRLDEVEGSVMAGATEVVVVDRPEHDAAEALFADVDGLVHDGAGVVVAHPLIVLVRVWTDGTYAKEERNVTFSPLLLLPPPPPPSSPPPRSSSFIFGVAEFQAEPEKQHEVCLHLTWIRALHFPAVLLNVVADLVVGQVSVLLGACALQAPEEMHV
jgi:hypothetical protein